MKATAALHELGQSIWLDNITREMLDSGQLQRYIDDYSVTGLTSNPSIFDKAIASGAYDAAIREKAGKGLGREELFFHHSAVTRGVFEDMREGQKVTFDAEPDPRDSSRSRAVRVAVIEDDQV